MFVRDIKTAPEPAINLASDQQLNDLVRFGAFSEELALLLSILPLVLVTLM